MAWRVSERMMKSNTNQLISINLSSTPVSLFGLDVLCVSSASLSPAPEPYNQFRETVRLF